MTLADVYVEPSFRVFNECLIDEYGHNGYPFSNVSDESIHNFIHRHLETDLPNDIYKCISPNLFFILGYPGQGKSSFCKKMLNDTYSQKKPLNKEVHFIKFRTIINSADLINNPLQTLYEHWKEDSGFTKIDKNEFKDSILVLDGLDELFMKDNLTGNSINEFCRILIQQLESSEFPKVIITSRYGYADTRRLKSLKTLILQIEEFDLNRQIDWLSGYQVFHPETTMNIEKLTNYNTDITFKSIKELITQPILLHMIVTLNQEVTIDMDRAMIYNNIFDSLIDRKWAKEGQIEILRGINKEDLRNFLRDIAFAIFVSGYEYIHKSKLIKLSETQEFIDKLENKDSVQDVLKNIMVAFYFQETKKNIDDADTNDKSDYAIEFLHKSLQEYLVAEKIWEELLLFTDKVERKNTFVIDDAEQALRHLIQIFQENSLTDEIKESLKQVMQQKEISQRQILSERFEKFLPTWLNFGFVIEYHWKNRSKEDIEGELFENFWFILNNLISGKDYLSSYTFTLFDFLSRINAPEDIDWSNQIIKGNLNESLLYDEEYFEHYNTILRFILLNEIDTSTIIKNFTLMNLHLNDCCIKLDYRHSILIDECAFSRGLLLLTDGINQKINNSRLNNTNILLKQWCFENCNFFRCTITIYINVNMSNIHISNCNFKECLFYIHEDFDKTLFDNETVFQNCAIITSVLENDITY